MKAPETKITNTKWAEWGELKGVIFETTTTPTTPKQEDESKVSEKAIGSATVNATKVALRESPSTKANVLTRVDIGGRVQLLPENSEWVRVSYQGKVGYMMKKFLSE